MAMEGGISYFYIKQATDEETQDDKCWKYLPKMIIDSGWIKDLHPVHKTQKQPIVLEGGFWQTYYQSRTKQSCG